MNDECEAKLVIDGAKIVGNKLTAGGPGTNFTLFVPLFGDTLLPVNLYSGGIEADIVLQNGKIVSMKNGVLGGAFEKSLFAEILDQVPPEDLPASKEAIVDLLNVVILDDIDTTGDGKPNTVSVGFTFEAFGGNIVGIDD